LIACKKQLRNTENDEFYAAASPASYLISGTYTKSTSTPIFAATKSNQTQYEF